MLKSSFLVILVSILCIIKRNSAAIGTKNDDQPQSSGPPPIKGYEPFTVVISLQGLMLRMPHTIITETPMPQISGKETPMPQASIEETPMPQASIEETPPPTSFQLLSATYKLPSKFIKRDKELGLASGPDHMMPVPLCPEFKSQSNVAKNTLYTLSQVVPATENCLFMRGFEENEPQMCNLEPELSLDKKEEDKSFVVCGINEHQQFVDAQYYNCGNEKDLLEYTAGLIKEMKRVKEDVKKFKYTPFQPLSYLMYEICYDFQQKQTLWTRYSPMTPALLAHPESPFKNLSNEFETYDFNDDISLLNLESSTFSRLKTAYLNTNTSTTKAFTMVPKDHMAMPYWKKATTHIINAAPLSPKFIPLMKAINNGILLASSNLFAKSKDILQIYTHAAAKLSIVNEILSKLHIFKPDLFEPNIWYKFIHNLGEKSGVLIVLHNTNKVLPQEEECDKDERLTCDFQAWSNSDELIPKEILDHAYCCKTTAERVKELFSMNELVLKDDFDIQKMINEKPIEPVENTETGGNKDEENDH